MSGLSFRRFRSLRLENLEKRLALATLYVSPSGSDSNTGAADAPWQTLQHAADVVQPGDTVIVRPGNYTGFDLRRDGTSSAPITFRAESGAAITSRNAVTPDGINLEGADYIVIEGFTVNGMPRAGIRSVTNHHVTIRNNQADMNSRWGIFTGFSDDLLIEGNTTSRSQIEHGIYVSNSGDRPIIRNNVSFGNRAAGIHMNGDVSQGGDGIISAALVENNVIYDNGLGGGSGINADGVQDSVFQNNLLYNNHASGISLFRIDGGEPSSDNFVVNNTIVQAADGRWALNIQNASVDNTVLNNILYNNHSFRGSINISADSLSGFTSDFNVVMNRFTTNDGDSVMTQAQWQAATGQDRNSIVAMPSQLFVNPSASDYHLSATSPALDAGTLRNAPSRDYEGTTRPSGAGVDIGADERTAAPPVNQAPVGVADEFFTTEDSLFDLDVLLNDTDADNDALTVADFTQPSSGTVTRLPSGLLRYTPNANFNGSDGFTYRVSDGTALAAATTVSIDVSAVNDAPTNTVPGGQVVPQEAALVFSTVNGNAIRVTDIDAGANDVEVSLAVTSGALSLRQTTGLIFTAGDGVADASMTFRGSLAAINAGLDGLTYRPATGFSGNASLSITTSDLGSVGEGGAQSDADSVAIAIEPAAPTNRPPTDIELSSNTMVENSSGGTVVGGLTTIDLDTGDTHSLTLLDSAGGRFALSGNSLVVASGALLDYEEATSHAVTIRSTDPAGASIERTFVIQIVNVSEAALLEVQRGAQQRSYIRYVDLVFEDAADLDELVAEGRVRLIRSTLRGSGAVNVDLTGKLQALDDRLAIDFGLHGIGGNRNTSAGNGNYSLQLDVDGDGSFETTHSFFRMLGDTNGDRLVNPTDMRTVALNYGRRGPSLDADVNGDQRVDMTDFLITVFPW